MCTRYILTDPADAIRDLFRVTGRAADPRVVVLKAGGLPFEWLAEECAATGHGKPPERAYEKANPSVLAP